MTTPKEFTISEKALSDGVAVLSDLVDHPGWKYLVELVKEHETQTGLQLLDQEEEDPSRPLVYWKGYRACSRSILGALDVIVGVAEQRTKQKDVNKKLRSVVGRSGSGAAVS